MDDSDSEISELEVVLLDPVNDSMDSQNIQRKPSKGGPIPIEERFPKVVEIIIDILFQNGAQAHERRRNDTITSFGTHLPSLVETLLEQVPGLREHYPNLSKNTIGTNNI